MASRFKEHDFALALEVLWEAFKAKSTEDEQDALKASHPILEEVDDYGANGPVGGGLGRYGGHAIG